VIKKVKDTEDGGMELELDTKGMMEMGHILFLMDIKEAVKGAREEGKVAASIAMECTMDRVAAMGRCEAFMEGLLWWMGATGWNIDMPHFGKIAEKWYQTSLRIMPQRYSSGAKYERRGITPATKLFMLGRR